MEEIARVAVLWLTARFPVVWNVTRVVLPESGGFDTNDHGIDSVEGMLNDGCRNIDNLYCTP